MAFVRFVVLTLGVHLIALGVVHMGEPLAWMFSAIGGAALMGYVLMEDTKR